MVLPNELLSRCFTHRLTLFLCLFSLQQACRKQCLAFVVQVVELVGTQRPQLKVVMNAAKEEGLFERLSREVEERSSRHDAQQVRTTIDLLLAAPIRTLVYDLTGRFANDGPLGVYNE